MAAVDRIEGAAENADAARSVASCARRPSGATGARPLPHRFEQLGHALAGDAGDAEERQPELGRAAFERRRRRRRSTDRRRPSCWRRRSAAWRRASARTARARCRTVSRSSTGSRPVAPDMSTRCTSTFVRSRWRRNWWPRPWPRCAPSISPGTSATTKLRSSLEADDAEVRRQRGERVVGDLRPRRGDARDQRRLAGVGEADQADVGEQLQLEPQILDLRPARRAAPCAARGWWRSRSARCPCRRVRPWRRARAGLRRRDRRAACRRVLGVLGIAGLLVDERADRHRELEVLAAVRRCSSSPCRARRARRRTAGWKR